jgi:ferredoxin/flavodoxin---NADP+ reductase
VDSSAPIRVAIVGSGPSGLYAAAHLLESGDLSVEIDLFEKLPTPWGLSAREFVAFYNGHPAFSSLPFDLSVPRAIVVGNGNVALDVARILTMDVKALAKTDIADHALDTLRRSEIREVVILGRRGPLQAAYNNPELEELEHLENVDVAVAGMDPGDIDDAALVDADTIVRRKMATLRRLIARQQTPGNKHITFRFLRSPRQLQGDGKMERVVTDCNAFETDGSGRPILRATGETESIDAGPVLGAVGYRGTACPGLPFDDRRGVILNHRGRVTDGTADHVGVYTTGWIKRGCNGIIGSNKKCANETIRHLLEDLDAKRLPAATLDRAQVKQVLLKRAPRAIFLAQWIGIDHAERSAGRSTGRPRVKITSREGLLRAAAAVATE